MAMERERFARNLALMSGGPPGVAGEVVDGGRGEVASGSGSTERWAAIRGFISQTMERRIDGEKT